MKFTV